MSRTMVVGRKISGTAYKYSRKHFPPIPLRLLKIMLNTSRTEHLLGEKELAVMKETAYLINTFRGQVIDEAALVSALKKGQIGGAGLDVYEDEPELHPGLSELDNVILTPHIGSASVETRTRMAEMAVDNLLAGLRGDRMPNIINPEALA